MTPAIKAPVKIAAVTLLLAALLPPWCFPADRGPSRSATPATDSLGDPLPQGALMRLGTQRFRHPSSVVELTLSPDEKTVVTIDDQALIVWNTATGKERWRANPAQLGPYWPAASYGVRALAFAGESSRFYMPGKPNQIIAWDTASGEYEVLPFGGTLPVHVAGRIGSQKAIDVTRDGRKFAVGSPGGLVVCKDTGEVLFEVANAPKDPASMNGDRLWFGGHFGMGRFSPDETLLAVVTSDAPETLRLHDAATGEERRRIPLTSRLVRLAFSPDGGRIATTERDVAVRLYAVDSGKEVWSYKIDPMTTAESYTSAVAFSPDGTLIAVGAPIGSDYAIRLLDAATGRETGKLSGHNWKPWTLAFASDGNTLYSSGWDGTVQRWDVTKRQQLPLPSGVRATAVVAAAPDGRRLAYADDSGHIHLVDAQQGREIGILALPGTSYSQLAFSPDSSHLAGGGATDHQVHVAVWNLNSGEVVHRWDWPKGRDPHSDVESLSFSPDGTQLAAAVFRQSAAYLWDLTADRQIAQLRHGSVYGLSFSPDGKMLATAGWDKVVRFWDTDDGQMQREFKVANGLDDDGDHRMYTVCYAPRDGLLATAHLDGKVRIWNASDMALRNEFAVKGRFIYGAVAFSPDGSLLATGSAGGAVFLWDPLTSEVVWDVGRHEHYVYTVAFADGHRTLVSGGEDGVCYLWDLRPPDLPPNQDLETSWKSLAGSGAEAYRATWAMTETPGRTLAFLAKKLRPVTTVIDMEQLVEGLSEEEAIRRKRLARIMCDADDTIESSLVVSRAVLLLSQLHTPDAARLLRELAEHDPEGELGRLAAAALERLMGQ